MSARTMSTDRHGNDYRQLWRKGTFNNVHVKENDQEYGKVQHSGRKKMEDRKRRADTFSDMLSSNKVTVRNQVSQVIREQTYMHSLLHCVLVQRGLF